MKCIICTGFALIFLLKLSGQVNLVPNPSFEVFDTCPNYSSQIQFASPWFQPNYPQLQFSSSTDYFNVCNSNNTADVPQNFIGYQFPNTGDAYAGMAIFLYPSSTDGHEYLEVRLDSALTSSHRYCVSFYLSFANEACFPSSAIGVFFSKDTCQYGSFNYDPINVQPQLVNPSNNIISDSTNWTSIRWIYTPADTANFITIGNFWWPSYNIPNTDSICSSGQSYYYFDDFSIIKLPEISAGNDFSINPNDSISLQGIISEVWTGMQFEWFPHVGLDNPYSLNTNASPSVTTTYTLTVSCNSCNVPCLIDVIDSATVFVDPLPPPQINVLHVPSLIYTDQVFFIDSLPEGTRLKFFDMRGRMIFKSDNYENNYSVAALSCGNYLYEITLSNEESFKGKFSVVSR